MCFQVFIYTLVNKWYNKMQNCIGGENVADFIIIPFLIMLLYKSKLYTKHSEFNQEYLSVDNTIKYKGILALLVLLRHLTLVTNSGILGEITMPVSDLCVKMFFFISGYGVTCSFLENKSSSIVKRYKKLLIPLLMSSAFYLLYYLFSNTFYDFPQFSASAIFTGFFKYGYTFVYNTWFVIVLFIQYLFFMLVFEKNKLKDRTKILLLLLTSTFLTVVFFVMYRKVGWQIVWCISIYAFNFGVIWAKYKEELDSFFRYKFEQKYILAFFALIICVLVQEFLLKNVDVFYDIFKHLITSSFLILVSVLTMMKIELNNKIWNFVGVISYEIYLLHGFVYIFLKNNTFAIKNDLIYEIVAFIVTIILSYLIHYINPCNKKNNLIIKDEPTYIKRFTVENVTLLVFSTLLFLSAIAVFSTGGEKMSFLLWRGISIGIFPDFFESVIEASTKNPYLQGVIYPAFSYLILYPLSIILPGEYSSINDLLSISSTIQAYIVGCFFMILCFFSVLFVFSKMLKINSEIKKYLLCIVILFSAPSVYLFERGNIVILSVLLLSLFVVFYNSKNIYLKELSIVFLAFAANLKLLPALFGLMLIKKNDNKYIKKALIYGLALFVIPFFFFGGTNSIKMLIENIITHNSDAVNGQFGFGYKINIYSVLHNILLYYGVESANQIAKAVSYFIIAATFVSFFFVKKNWIAYLAIVLIIIQIPNFSYLYNGIYLIIPFAMFISENSKKTVTLKRFLIILLLGFSLMPFPFGEVFALNSGGNNMNYQTIFSAFGVLMLSLYVIYSAIKNAFLNFRQKKSLIINT